LRKLPTALFNQHETQITNSCFQQARQLQAAEAIASTWHPGATLRRISAPAQISARARERPSEKQYCTLPDPLGFTFRLFAMASLGTFLSPRPEIIKAALACYLASNWDKPELLGFWIIAGP
jgi:hypothetical protein